MRNPRAIKLALAARMSDEETGNMHTYAHERSQAVTAVMLDICWKRKDEVLPRFS